MNGGSRHCIKGSDQDHPQEKEMQNGKWLSKEALQIAEKRREAKSKGEKERYTHLTKEQQGEIRKPSSVKVKSLSRVRLIVTPVDCRPPGNRGKQ